MTQIGNNNEVLKENANFVWNGTLWLPQRSQSDGSIYVNIVGGDSIGAQLYGYVNSAWQKQPILPGYSDSIIDYQTGAAVGAGTVQISGYTVPTNNILKISAFSYYIGSATVNMVDYFITRSPGNYVLYRKITPGLNTYTSERTDVTMKTGDQITVNFYNATIGDTFILVSFGILSDFGL